MKKVLFYIAFLLALISCKKEGPKPTTGKAIIYGTQNNTGFVSVYINGSLEGTITKYKQNGNPQCGEQGFVTIKREAGAYQLRAVSQGGHVWEGILNITAGGCKPYGLN